MDGRLRVVIENVTPQVDGGRYPVKRLQGDSIRVSADVFADGHDVVIAALLYRKANESTHHEIAMQALGNDLWAGLFTVEEMGTYFFTVEGWIDHFFTWQVGFRKKYEANQELGVELRIGAKYVKQAATRAKGKPQDAKKLQSVAQMLESQADMRQCVEAALGDELGRLMQTYPDRSSATRLETEREIIVNHPRAGFSSWYEIFPRSWAKDPGKHGTFKDVERILPEIKRLGFDVLYFPPIHPIGEVNRKGPNNILNPGPEAPGCPWAIGSKLGGHKAIHPELGKLTDFKHLLKEAKNHGIDIALDIAFQCAPDHPYVKEHPDWFVWRPDGTVQYAENPPKKYEDVLPINFETKDWKALWEELKSVFEYWRRQGVWIFRVDNPHTKSLRFWEWCLSELRKEHPEMIFLSESFTRPKIMYNLAKAGYTQSYTYFTWRNHKQEIIDYMYELTQTEVNEFFRPNFWPNTPDILSPILQHGGRPAFMMRLILAATLSSNYGIYGPAFELMLNEPFPGKEEYVWSEKYEIKRWNWNQPGNLKELMRHVNKIRHSHRCLQVTDNIGFYHVDNDQMLAYLKAATTGGDALFVVVSLDPYHKQSGWVSVPLRELGLDGGSYIAEDLLSGARYQWQGAVNFVELEPHVSPAHIFRFHRV